MEMVLWLDNCYWHVNGSTFLSELVDWLVNWFLFLRAIGFGGIILCYIISFIILLLSLIGDKSLDYSLPDTKPC